MAENKTYNVIVNDNTIVTELSNFDYARGICRGISLCNDNHRFGDVEVELEEVVWNISIDFDHPVRTKRTRVY